MNLLEPNDCLMKTLLVIVLIASGVSLVVLVLLAFALVKLVIS